MKRFTIVMAAAVLMAGWAWPGSSSSAGAATAGRYIVVLKDNVSSPSSVADEHARRYGAQVGFVYSNALNGYSAVIPNDRVAQVRSDSRVAFISEDRNVEAVVTTPILAGD